MEASNPSLTHFKTFCGITNRIMYSCHIPTEIQMSEIPMAFFNYLIADPF